MFLWIKDQVVLVGCLALMALSIVCAVEFLRVDPGPVVPPSAGTSALGACPACVGTSRETNCEVGSAPLLALQEVVAEREDGDWLFQFRFVNNARHAIVTPLTAVSVVVCGIVANSALPGHEAPMASFLELRPSGSDSPLFTRRPLVRASSMPLRNEECAEELLGMLQDDAAPHLALPEPGAKRPNTAHSVSTPSGGTFSIRIRLRHLHDPRGNEEHLPLLGRRRFYITIGPRIFDRTCLLDAFAANLPTAEVVAENVVERR